MNARGEGFTLAELMIVLAVISIITVVAITSFRSGLYANYAVSQTARKLIVALQETRMRAFQNERISRVNSVTAVGTENQYQVTLMGTENVFEAADYAAFSGLSSPVGMNGGAYYVLAVSKGANAITVAYPGDANSAVTTETPIAKNISRAATLTIRKRESRDEGPPGYGEFVYDSERMGIWIEGDYSPSPGGPAEPAEPMTVAFNSRGFAADPNGYRIIIARKRPGTSEFYYKDGTTVTNALVVTVSPFGMVKSGY